MSISEYAPIIIVCYNNADKLKTLLESIQKNKEFHLSKKYFFCDGHSNNKNDDKKVDDVIDLIEDFSQKNLHCSITKRKKNIGLYSNITNAVSTILEKHDKCIILEDDLIVSEKFLEYMNFYLDLYHDTSQVGSISAYTPPVLYSRSNYFFKGGDCWGWGTWARAWKNFENDSEYLYKKVKTNKMQFTYYFTSRNLKLLRDNINYRKSWAINWHSSLFMRDMLTLAPAKTLVRNLGHAGGRTNSGRTIWFNQNVSNFFLKKYIQPREFFFTPFKYAISNIAYYLFRIFELIIHNLFFKK